MSNVREMRSSIWLGRAALVLLGALLLAVIFSPRNHNSTLWLRTLHDAAHGPIFGCIALALLYLLRTQPWLTRLSLTTCYVTAFVLAVGLGLFTEVAQHFTGRDASFKDLAMDGLGAAAALLLFATVDPRRNELPRAHRAIWVAPAILALALMSWPLAQVAQAYVNRAQGFPVLADFTDEIGTRFVRPRRARASLIEVEEQWAERPRERALRVQLFGRGWPGLHLAETEPNWRGYRALVLDLVNPMDTPLELTVRIDDRKHDGLDPNDRYNATYTLPPLARTALKIDLADVAGAPERRTLDLGRIARVVMFRPEASGETFYFVRAWLE